MKCNVGGIDMTVRIIVGAILLVVGFAVPMATVWEVIVFLSAAVLLVTGILRYCPFNAMLKINTCEGGKGHEPHPRAG